jgi:hypothetical protein
MNTEFGNKGLGASNLKNVLQPGTRLQNGKYILLEVYGQGPFTISYLARQTVLGKKVIINEFFLLEHCSRTENEVINKDLNENIFRTFRDNWLGEAALLSKYIGNEHFVTVLDSFEENGTAYYVTEYINEEDLRTYTLSKVSRHLEEDEAVNFINQIATGLSVLHANGIFHLHLSPIKVLVDKNGKAVIFSIGISRKHITPEVLRDILTLTKPGYSSPELYNRDLEYGVFSDIYSVGAIFYFLVTGKDPLSAPERLNTPLPEPKSINPSVSSRTNSAIMKAMAPDPADRYRDLNELLHDLKSFSHQHIRKNKKKILFYSALALVIIGIMSFLAIEVFTHTQTVKQMADLVIHKKVNRQVKLAQLSLNEDKMRGVTMLKDADAHDSLIIGKYYALLIGIQNYKDSRYQKLSEPLNDVKSMYDVLVTNYTFDKNNVTVLTDPDRKGIYKALNFYRDSIGPNDNLFVFYAGHGRYEEKPNVGYLIPSDADYTNEADWLSFQEIKKKFEEISARHILMVADACYAGSIFRGGESDTDDAIDEMVLEQLSKKSRSAFTSADLKPVPDRSDFLKHLISNLKNNRARFFLSEDLYINTRNSLIRGTSKKDPVKWGVLRDCGDEGGDFIFIRRSN